MSRNLIVLAVIVLLCVWLPRRAEAAAIYIDGTGSNDTIRVGQRLVSGNYRWYSCINGNWVDEGPWSSADNVYITTSWGDDTVQMQTADGAYNCGGDSQYLFAYHRGACPNLTRVSLGRDNDRFYGSSCTDEVYGGDGNDYIDGWASYDYLYGEGGNDTLLGYTGNDLLSGGAGDDSLSGEADADVLNGDDGTGDALYGGAGGDCLRDTAYTTCDCGSGTDNEECSGATVSCEYENCLSKMLGPSGEDVLDDCNDAADRRPAD